VLNGPEGATFELVVRSQRAGVMRHTVVLNPSADK
jgi:hypothetical protein